MIVIKIVRKWFTVRTSIGEFTVVGDNGDILLNCYSLEDVARAEGIKIKGQTCIPAGTYTVVFAESTPKHPDGVPLLLDVPMFTAIEIHIGNFDIDTEGCILVGMDKSPDNGHIDQSTVAFNKLMDILKPAFKANEKVTIEITNQQEV